MNNNIVQVEYLDLSHEVVDMWNVDSAIIVKILIFKSLNNHLRRIGGDTVTYILSQIMF